MADASGVRKFLRRTLSLQQIKDLSATAHAAILAGEDKVAITSNAWEGGSASGSILVSSAMVGSICEELIEELEGTITTVNRFRRASFAHTLEGNQ
jgi:hypothetical protein